MSAPIITVEHLAKCYRIGRVGARGDGLRHRLEHAVRNPGSLLRRNTSATTGRHEDFWALRDVTFQVEPGEVVGVIGRNGAGKSTLLKILSRITSPTSGRARLGGRVASLLEVGTGFHPELTGRENVFLNGAILGMTRVEVRRKFDEIVAFSEVEKFIDTPVKRYSSGMYVRLAFAVAAHLEPEILIVDEVLAVGDTQFQKKCLGRISAVARSGRTVLFVSHNMGVVGTLCSKIVLLENGSSTHIGPPEEVIPQYLRSRDSRRMDQKATSPGGEITLLAAEACDASGGHREQFQTNEPVHIALEFQVNKPVSGFINPVLEVKDAMGQLVFSSSNFNERAWFSEDTPCGSYRSVCVVPPDTLNDRDYSVDILFCHRARDVVLQVERALTVSMVDSGQYRDVFTGPRAGLVRPDCRWTTSALAPNQP